MAVATATAQKSTPLGPQPAAPAPKAPLGLRETQTHKLPTERMKPVGYFCEPQQVMIKAGWDLDDIFKPEFWSFIAPSLQANPSASVMHDRLGTVLHVHTEDHAFYAVLYVHGLQRNSQGQANAVNVTCIGPGCDPETGKACAVDVKTGLPWKGRA